MAADCIFCKIIGKEIPSEFIYEDEDMIAIRDINPKAPVHLLIIPRKHIRSINDIEACDEVLIGRMMTVARGLAEKEGTAQSGYRVFFNVEKGGGQEVFHLHLHLVGGFDRA
ncbi:histidine triad nucleotide-binding protein [Desulfoluna butyratoxydans]|uniref:Histidine triad (Hit) protein n=1 Tax=Desulfoluna butyratoxydans TaxID=231438 RepID=A0A4V6IM10_9BACT|nr:histidine triad nucleotide-binding protein [Desulfoluna butyratoxydans]VFQ47168.1 histidine triad (hit) protein [Desulfoluna butyratoxydans]